MCLLSIRPSLAAHFFIAGKSPEAKFLYSFIFLIFLQHHLRDLANPPDYPALRKQEICSARKMGSKERFGASFLDYPILVFSALLAK